MSGYNRHCEEEHYRCSGIEEPLTATEVIRRNNTFWKSLPPLKQGEVANKARTGVEVYPTSPEGLSACTEPIRSGEEG